MGIFDNKNGGFMDEIRCDEPSYLVWKWHPKGSQSGSNSREDAIRWGSSLRVRDGSVAVFVYNQKNGVYQDFIEGPFDQILKTANLPVLASVVGLAYDGGTPFQAEVYFINVARIVQVRFAVPYFDVYDPRYLDFAVPVAVRGTISFCIADYREFIKINRLDEFSIEDFQKQIRDVVARHAKTIVANIPGQSGLPVWQIERKTDDVASACEDTLRARLREDFGVSISGIDIGAIEIDKSSDGYRQLKAITQDMTTQVVQAQTAVNIKNLQDTQHINAQNMEETLRIQREESQYAQHKTTQSNNFAAYQIEQQAAVGIAGAEALGQMGANGATSMSTGSGGDSGSGMDVAGMVAGLAMGGAIGQNMAGMMNGMMGEMTQTGAGKTPPPVPKTVYFVARDGEPAGPYSISELSSLVSTGALSQESLVWKEGMNAWIPVRDVQEIASLPFGDNRLSGMPPIPVDEGKNKERSE